MLDALGNIGDFVGGIAVIVTLIYLAIQVRGNTAALQTASRQEIAAGLSDWGKLQLEPRTAHAYARGIHAYPDPPFEERSLFWYALSNHALFFQGAFALHESGQLEEETFQAYLDWFACHVATPGGGAWWDELGRPFFTKRMVEVVDARLARGGLPDIRGLGAYRLDETPAPPSPAQP